MQKTQQGLIYPAPMGSYGVMFLRPVAVFLCVALGLAACPQGARAGDWEVVTHEGRQYVTVASMADFYGFPGKIPAVSEMGAGNGADPAAKNLLLDNGKHQVVLRLGSRLAVIDGVNQWLGFPVTEDGDRLIVSRLDLTKAIEPSLRPEFITGMGPVDTVVLDPGHGGHDKGAVCIFGNEKDFALDVCLRARKLLEGQGLKVKMTRTDDTFIPLEERPAVANGTPNSIFVAIHFNDSMENPLASGFEIYSITPQGEASTADNTLALHDLRAEPGNVTDTRSLALGESIYNALLGNIPQADRGVKHARFAVLRLAQEPAVLIEGGFVSSDMEAREIATPAYRQELAEAVVAGIVGYKGLAEHRVPPKLLAAYRNEPGPGVGTSPVVVTNAPPADASAPSAEKEPASSTP